MDNKLVFGSREQVPTGNRIMHERQEHNGSKAALTIWQKWLGYILFWAL